jgi:hypothetical protein
MRRRQRRTWLSATAWRPPLSTPVRPYARRNGREGIEPSDGNDLARVDAAAQLLRDPGREPGALRQQRHGAPRDVLRCAPDPRDLPADQTHAQGTLVEGSFTAANVTGIDFNTLIEELRAGTAYVNFHTTTYPAGEIRGQVRLLN